MLLCKTENGGNRFGRGTKTKRNRKRQRKKHKEKHILCKFCEHKITTTNCKTEIQGAFRHTFLNPTGRVFEIGCFTKADGCISLGIPSQEWTWFQDFSWQVSICGSCSGHLGWFYRGEEGRTFFGLILGALI